MESMDVNAKDYRWSEWLSPSKKCQMCDMGEDETVKLVIMKCEKYDSYIKEIMQVILTEMRCEIN